MALRGLARLAPPAPVGAAAEGAELADMAKVAEMAEMAEATARARLYAASGRLLPLAASIALGAAGLGLWLALVVAPAEGPLGDAERVAALHLPPAWTASALYLALLACAALGALSGRALAWTLAAAIAPSGALMSLLALWTGALWGKPLWGHWWVWDARLATTLALLALFVACTLLREGAGDARQGERRAALLALAGVLLLPLLLAAVDRPSTLHGPLAVGVATLSLAFVGWSVAAVLQRLRCVLLERWPPEAWALALPEAGP